MRRPRKLLWLALAVGGLALVALWPRSGRQVRLPDGSVLELKAVTAGTNHYFRYRSGWEIVLGVLPDSWEEKITNRRARKFQTEEPKLVFWLVSRGSSPTGPPFRPYLCDENGIGTSRDIQHNTEWVSSNTLIEEISFDCFPRRSKTLTLHFYDQRPEATNPPVAVGEFTIPNPFHTDTRPWTPEPLPITRRFEDVTMTLTECSAGVDTTNVLARPASPIDGHLCLRFRVEPERTRLNDWRVDLVKLRDASGNYRLLEGPAHRDYRPGDQKVVCDKFLFSDDPSWKIQVSFYQDLATPKPKPGELRTIPDIPIADRYSTVQWTALNPAWFGALVKVSAYHFRTPQDQGVAVDARIEPGDQGHHLVLVEARDAKGRTYRPVGGQGTRFECYWTVNVPADAKTVTLTFHLRQGHWEEFLVRPEFPFARSPGK